MYGLVYRPSIIQSVFHLRLHYSCRLVNSLAEVSRGGGACGKSIPGLKTQSERKEEKKEKKNNNKGVNKYPFFTFILYSVALGVRFYYLLLLPFFLLPFVLGFNLLSWKLKTAIEWGIQNCSWNFLEEIQKKTSLFPAPFSLSSVSPKEEGLTPPPDNIFDHWILDWTRAQRSPKSPARRSYGCTYGRTK